MEIEALLDAAAESQFRPVHLLVGKERFLIERVIARLRKACLADGLEGFNDDTFYGPSTSATSILEASRTMPMMAQARFVLVRQVEALGSADLDRLAEYLGAPCPSTCLVLSAEKLDGRSRLARAAKSNTIWTEAKTPRPNALRGFVAAEAKARGHRMGSEAAHALVDAVGEELAALDDAVERLSLYVGAGTAIEAKHVETCIARVRVDSIWSLVDAVAVHDAPRALESAASLLRDREPPLRILAMVARQLRIVAKMREALANGMNPRDAASQAGAPPFKAQELTRAARQFNRASLKRAFTILAETDLALKSSRRPPATVLEQGLLELVC